MNGPTIGIGLTESTPDRAIDVIRRAEEAGVAAVWMTAGRAGPDPLITFAAAARETSRIKMGTSIVPTYPRHPLALAMQSVALGQLAPDRFRLGVGPSHKPMMENIWGIPFKEPLSHLREYVGVLRQALTTGDINVDGPRFSVHNRIDNPPQVPIMISALRQKAFTLAGEIADGAISWVSPAPYLRDTAIPAIAEGARSAGRSAPPLVAHCFISVSESTEAVYEAARRQVALYPKLPFYSKMFQDAGYPEAADGTLSDRMIDAVVVHGNEEQVAAGLRTFADAGAGEIIASLMPVGDNRDAAINRCLKAIAAL